MDQREAFRLSIGYETLMNFFMYVLITISFIMFGFFITYLIQNWPAEITEKQMIENSKRRRELYRRKLQVQMDKQLMQFDLDEHRTNYFRKFIIKNE